jgi:hypothetical protein
MPRFPFWGKGQPAWQNAGREKRHEFCMTPEYCGNERNRYF